MAWEYRNGKQYYYLCQRVNGKVKKLYFGCGPEAELAAATVEANRLNRKENRVKLNAAKAGLKLAGRQMEQLRRAPLDAIHSQSAEELPADSRQKPSLETPPDIVKRAQELLIAREAGDPSAEKELTDLIDQHPGLVHRFVDLGRLLQAKWLALIVGNDVVFQSITAKKLENLRLQFPTGGSPVGKLLLDRIVASYLQLTFAEGKMAEVGTRDRSSFNFFAKLQETAQRQHLQAIRAWNQWAGANRYETTSQTEPAGS